LVLVAIASAGLGTWRDRRCLSTWPVPLIVAALLVLTCCALCRPVKRPPAAFIIDELKTWLAENGLSQRRIITANVWLDYAIGRSLPRNRPAIGEQLRRAPLGSLFAWDRKFAESQDSTLSLDRMYTDPNFRKLHETRPLPYGTRPYLIVFEKVGRGEQSQKGGSVSTPDKRSSGPQRTIAAPRGTD
jgi:hypothetical protein